MILHHSNITTSNKCYKIICMIIVLYKIWGLNKIHWPIFTHKEILKYKFLKTDFCGQSSKSNFPPPLIYGCIISHCSNPLITLW